jgi:uncharacterized protein YjbJ (UPF0337 family)
MADFSDLKGNWDETRSKLKQIFVVLADDDLTYIDDKQDELWDRIQIKLGKSKAEIQSILSGL